MHVNKSMALDAVSTPRRPLTLSATKAVLDKLLSIKKDVKSISVMCKHDFCRDRMV